MYNEQNNHRYFFETKDQKTNLDKTEIYHEIRNRVCLRVYLSVDCPSI